MDRSATIDVRGHATRVGLRDCLAEGDAMLAGIEPILGHLLSAPDHSLFSDEIIARVRGMLAHVARQILLVQAETEGSTSYALTAERHEKPLAHHFQSCSALLTLCHALAIEWQLAQRLEAETGLDPVLSPLLQRWIADPVAGVSSGAMAVLAAQARYAQSQRRMELGLGELPAEVFHQTLLTWRSYTGEQRSDGPRHAEVRLRREFDESKGRLALLERLVGGSQGSEALALEEAGAALFFSALSTRSGQPRAMAVLSSHARQAARFVLGLRAAGVKPRAIDEALLRIHPGAAPFDGLAEIDELSARGILLDSLHRQGR